MQTEKKVRLGIIGLGVRTEVLLVSLRSASNIEIAAVCDISDKAIAKIMNILKADNQEPAVYKDYRELLERGDIDAVMAPTSWAAHLPIAADAMKAGKYVAIEVGGASSTDELWNLVRASEETGAHCMMLENCCYGRVELMILNMVRQGVFGELIHCAGGYEHDLRDMLGEHLEDGYERTIHNRYRNCDLYPTHQLGPIAKILGINRGNRFMSLTSTASKSRSQQAYNRNLYGRNSPQSEIVFNKGDVVTTVITCARGETITLTHSISLPRPYSRNGRVQGTKGIWSEDCDGIYIDGISPSVEKIDVAGNPYLSHDWDPVSKYHEQYEHPLWRGYKDNTVGGHSGLDYLTMQAFIHAVRNKIAPPIDVYDCAAWMSVSCLSEQSIAMGSHPVPFPDFTNGKWMKRKPSPANRWSLDDVHPESFKEQPASDIKNKINE